MPRRGGRDYVRPGKALVVGEGLEGRTRLSIGVNHVPGQVTAGNRAAMSHLIKHPRSVNPAVLGKRQFQQRAGLRVPSQSGQRRRHVHRLRIAKVQWQIKQQQPDDSSKQRSILDFGFWILDYVPIQNPKSKIQNPRDSPPGKRRQPKIGQVGEAFRAACQVERGHVRQKGKRPGQQFFVVELEHRTKSQQRAQQRHRSPKPGGGLASADPQAYSSQHHNHDAEIRPVVQGGVYALPPRHVAAQQPVIAVRHEEAEDIGRFGDGMWHVARVRDNHLPFAQGKSGSNQVGRKDGQRDQTRPKQNKPCTARHPAKASRNSARRRNQRPNQVHAKENRQQHLVITHGEQGE